MKLFQNLKKGITSFLLFEFHALWSRRWPTISVCLSQHRDAKINGRGSLSHLMPVGRRGRELLLLLLPSWSSLLSVRRVRRQPMDGECGTMDALNSAMTIERLVTR